MDDGKRNEAQNPRDGVNEPVWPQRPARPQPPVQRPRLDPPVENPRSGQTYRAAEQPVYPVAQTPANRPPETRRDDTKETQILPVVEPSRFDRGAGAQTRPTPTVNGSPNDNPNGGNQSRVQAPQPA